MSAHKIEKRGNETVLIGECCGKPCLTYEPETDSFIILSNHHGQKHESKVPREVLKMFVVETEKTIKT